MNGSVSWRSAASRCLAEKIFSARHQLSRSRCRPAGRPHERVVHILCPVIAFEPGPVLLDHESGMTVPNHRYVPMVKNKNYRLTFPNQFKYT